MAIAVQSVSLYHSIGTIVLLFHPIHWLFSRMGCYHGSKIIPSFFTIKEGSTSHLGLLSSGEKKETALLGAQNRYAIRLAGHQSPRHIVRDGTAFLLSC